MALALAGLVFVAAAFSIAWMIVRYGVNVAVQDQIRIGAFLVRNHGRLFPSIADLFAQHNESRKFFPRIIFFYLARLTHWNVKAEMGVSLALACATVVALGVVACRTIADRNAAILATAAAALLMLSPVQWPNWLFGIQIVVYLPLLMLAAGLVAADRHPIVAGLCALVATYSYANGMLLWLLLGAAVCARRSKRVLVLWIAASAVSIGAYFIGYQKPAASPPFVFRPLALSRFILAFLGRPLGGDSYAVNALIGAAGVALFVLLIVRTRSLPWTAFGFYSIISAAITAAGRIGFGEEYATEPRYTTFAIPMWIAVAMLVAMSAKRRVCAIAACAFLVLNGFAIANTWPKLQESYRDRLLARAATQLAFVLPDQSLVQRLVEEHTGFALSVIAGLAKIGYVNPPPLSSNIVIRQLDAGATRGAFEGIIRLPDAPYLYGWALLPDGRPADAVLITRGDRIVALSERTVIRANVPGLGWDLPARRDLAVPGASYRAWAYDASTQRAYRLAGGISVRTGARY